MVGSIRQNLVISALSNGQSCKAKRLLQVGCKTKPELQAVRLALVCLALADPKGSHNRPDLADDFLKEFRKW